MSAQPTACSAFVSHATPDSEKALEIVTSLETRGLTCWVAPRDVRPGKEFGEEIIRGIENSRCLVLVLSEAANSSIFVRREVERAVSKGKPVFSIRVEEVLPSRALELFVSSTHWIDAWSGGLLDHVDQLARELKDERSVQNAEAAVKRVRRRARQKRWMLFTLGFVAVVAAIVIGNMLSKRIEKRPAAEEKVVSTPQDGDVPKILGQFNPESLIETMGGVRLNSLRAEDFAVRVQRVSGTKSSSQAKPSHAHPEVADQLEIEVEGKSSIESMLEMATLSASIDGGSFFPITRGRLGKAAIAESQQSALRAAKQITIKYEFPSGRVIGPFTYPVDAKSQFLASRKADFLERSASLQVTNDQCMFMMTDRDEIVRAIRFGESEETLNDVLMVEERVSMYGGLEGMPIVMLVPIRVGAKQIVAQYEFRDGSRSDPIRPQIAVLRPREDRFGARALPVSEGAPTLFVSFSLGDNTLNYVPLAPTGTARTMYSFDQGGLLPSRRSTQEGPAIFSWDGPLEAATIRVQFELQSGRLVGPYQYESRDAESFVLASMKERVAERVPECAAAIRVLPADPTSEAENSTQSKRLAQQASQQRRKRMQEFGREHGTQLPPLTEEESAVVCVPRHAHNGVRRELWASVRKLHAGPAPDQLTVLLDVDVEWKSPTRSADPLWHIRLPADLEQLYIKLEYFDGESSETVRVPISSTRD